MHSRLPALSSLVLAFTLAALTLARTQEPASPDGGSQRTVVDGAVMSGLLIRRVQPVYPPLARQARIQGTVILRATITTSGDVVNLQLISGHPMLAPAAIEAVKQWKYRPYMLNGEAVPVQTEIQVNFRLADEPDAVVGDSPGMINFKPPVTCRPEAASDTATSPCVRVSEAVMRATRIQKVDPNYPPLALQTRIQGEVILNVFIDTNGDISDVKLISGHPTLSPAAIEAVRQWRYTPYLLNGSPVNVQTMVRLKFIIPPDNESQGSVIDTPLVSDSPIANPLPEAVTGEIAPVPQPAIGVPKRIRVSSGIAQGLLTTKVNPEYPPDAREARIQGVVILKVQIDEEGNVAQIELVSGHPMLAPAAIEAVKQWKYKAFLLNGNPMMVETQVQVNFTLSGS
jgi:TonB family protein